MRKLGFLTIFIGSFLFAGCASATTYYISFSSGSNANNGTSKSTPWKTHPYMQTASGCTGTGSAPSYSHSAGDQFIFKQGDSWPNACFEMQVQNGGVPGNPDLYTFDPTWGTPGGTTGNTGQPVGTYQFSAGGSVINGAGGMNRFVSMNGVSDVTFNGVELTGMTWTGSGGSFGNVLGFSLLSNTNVIISKMYCHGWTHSGANSDALFCVEGYNYSPYGAGNRLTGSVCDGLNTGGPGVSDSGGCVYMIPQVDNSIAKNMSNGFLVGYNAVVHDTMIGPINVSFDSSAHENCIEPLGLIPGLISNNYIYDNVWHDCYAVGILTQGGAGSNGVEKDYLWNNVVYVGSQVSTIPIQFDSVSTSNSSSEVHAWNNTIYGGNNGGTGYCMHSVGRGNGNFGVLDLQNNHCISEAPNLILLDTAGNTYTNKNNVLMSPATAASQGYTSSETYAYSPTAATNGTVGAGINLANTLSGLLTNLLSSVFSTLSSDTSYVGVRLTKSRPATGPWDAGAYQYSASASSGAPSPPTNVKVIGVQ